MSTRTAELVIKLSNVKSIDDLKTTLKEINKELVQTDVNSEAFTELAGVAKDADKQLKDLKENLKGVTDNRQVAAIGKMGQGLAGAFSVATIASTHFGKETSDSVARAIRVATELSAVLTSIKAIQEAASLSNLKAFASYVTGFRAATVAAEAYGTASKIAMASTVIGLLVVGLIAVASQWDNITKAVGGAYDETKKFLGVQEQLIKNQESYNKAINDAKNLEIEIAKIRGEQGSKVIERQIAANETQISQEREKQKILLESYQKTVGLQYSKDQAERESFEAAKKAYFDQRHLIEDLGNQNILLQEQKKKALEEEAKEAKKKADEANKYATKVYDENLKQRQKIDKQGLEFDKELYKQKVSIAKSAEIEITQAHQGSADSIQRIDLEFAAAQKQQLKDQRDRQIEYYETIGELSSEQEDVLRSLRQERFNEEAAQVMSVADTIGQGINGIANALTDSIQTTIDGIQMQMDVIDQQYKESVVNREAAESELATATGARRAQLIADIDKEKDKEKQLALEKKRLMTIEINAKNKQNDIEYKNNIIQSIIATARGVLAALATTPPLSYALAAINGVLGGIQTGIVISNKPAKIPVPASSGGLVTQYGFTGNGGKIDSTGEKQAGLYQLHANEWIAPRWMVESYSGLFSQLENRRVQGKAKPAADGGFTSSTPQVPSSIPTYNITPETIRAAVQSANIRVSVDEINSVQSNVRAIEADASI